MGRLTLRTRIGKADTGNTLLGFLSARFRYHGQDEWRAHIAQGRVQVDGARATADTVLRSGQTVSYDKEHTEPDAPTDVRIVHDRAGLVVVDKPAGLPVHADGAFLTRTLVAVLERELGVRPRVVHRLDRETSGLCVLARDRATARALHQALAAGAFVKTYEAIVHGVVAEDSLTIDLPLGRDPASQVSIRRAALPQGAPGAEPAHTDVVVLARGASATLVRCRPRTGRTHQIRAHLAASGHPVLGDVLYGRSDAEFLGWVSRVKAGADPGEGREAPRHMLHAQALELPDPASGVRLRLEAARPADFVGWGARMGLPE